jgi:hypothetical protein
MLLSFAAAVAALLQILFAILISDFFFVHLIYDF